MSITSKEAKVKLNGVFHTLTSLALLVVVAVAPSAAQEQEASYHEHELEVGYRAISTDDDTNPVRAREYDYLHSSPAGKLQFKGGTAYGHYNLEGTYLNEKDFNAEANINAGSVFRLNLFSQSLFHNLEHIPYAPGSPGARNDAFTDPAGDPSIKFTDADPTDTYGIRVLQNQGEVIIKPKSYPAHLKLRYWRLDRSGSQQLRWVDEGAGGTVNSTSCGTCHMQSKTRNVDNFTEEFTAAVDAHLGSLDLILEQTFRKFHDSEPIPRDEFGSFSFLRASGFYEHDEFPDSRLTTTTVKAHTSLSGGFVAAGSVTFGKRENRSDLSDVRPVESETTYVKGAGDVTWIPTGAWTLNLRYRALDLENDSTEAITSDGTTIVDRETRNNLDLRNYDYVTTVAFRPTPKVTLKAEGEYQEICRSNTGGPSAFSGFGGVIDPVWELPADEMKTRFKFSALARPLAKRNALKLRSWYQYQHSNDPAYGSSIEDGHAAFLGAEWHPSMRWGIGVNARAEFDKNRDSLVVLDDGNTNTPYFRDRDSEKQNLTAMLWANPTETFSFGAYYGYLRTRIEQDLLFGTQVSGGFVLPANDTEYSQWVQTATANFNWTLLRKLTLRGKGRYIRSHADYDPEFLDTTLAYSGFATAPTATSEGLRQLSKIDIRQFGGSAGLDWTPGETWRTSFTYTYDKYDDLDAEIFDGTVETYMVSLAKSW